jgi:PiT family inorganic phosphate transporter
MSFSLALILGLSIIYGYLNGVLSAASVVATIISSRALSPRAALLLAAIGMTLGPFVLGVAVVNTIASQFVSPEAVTPQMVIAGLLGGIIWSSFTLLLQIPSSNTQCLMGGLIGAAWAGAGAEAIQSAGLIKILIGLFLSPILGLFVAFWVVRLIYYLGQWASPHINRWFNRGQVLVAVLMSLSFGANDGQKMIAVLTLGLTAAGVIERYTIPTWTIVLSALTVGLGTLTGGSRLIHKLGSKFYRIRPVNGFGAQVASTGVIFGAGVFGIPVSGSQVVTSAIIGAGSAERIQKVRWGVMQEILLGWLLTLPFSALLAFIIYYLLEQVPL